MYGVNGAGGNGDPSGGNGDGDVQFGEDGHDLLDGGAGGLDSCNGGRGSGDAVVAARDDLIGVPKRHVCRCRSSYGATGASTEPTSMGRARIAREVATGG